MKSTSEELREQILQRGNDVLKAWIGDERVKRRILAILVAGKNLLLEGPPGSGKTLIGRELARALPPMLTVDCDFNCYPEHPTCPQCSTPPKALSIRRKGRIVEVPGQERFVRVQGSPELAAEDLIGDIDPVSAFRYGPFDSRAFKPGKIVRANRKILFIDEINRIPERLQNTLLQMLQERVMTIGGLEIEFGIDTVFITTMNPEEHAGVYRISEALRDRLEKVKITYPSIEEELKIIDIYGKRLGAEVPAQLERKIVDITQRTRTDKAVNQPASVRATLAMYELTQSYALLRGDKTATVDDIRDAAEVALQGRVLISPDSPHYDEPARYFREIIDYTLGMS